MPLSAAQDRKRTDLRKKLRNRRVIKQQKLKTQRMESGTAEEREVLRIEFQELVENDDQQVEDLVCEGIPALVDRFAQEIKDSSAVNKAQLVVYLERIERKIISTFRGMKI